VIFLEGISSFINFHGWTFVPLRWLQIHIIHKNGWKENMNCELKTFQFALNMLKFNLEGSLNFERAPLKLQRAIKSKEKKRKGREKSWVGGGDQGGLIFLGRSFSRPEKIKALDSPNFFNDMGSSKLMSGSSQSEFGLDNLAMLIW
jgi:hypothetical protein